MPRYSRLREHGFEPDESELFEVDELSFTDKTTETDSALGERRSSDVELAQQQQKSSRDHVYSVPSTGILTSQELRCTKGYPDNCGGQPQQNIENGNPNVCTTDPTTQPTIVAICSHNSPASGAPLQEHQQHLQQQVRAASGRWVGRTIDDRSRRWVEAHYRDNAGSGEDENYSRNSSEPSPIPAVGGQWAPSIQRGPSYREPAQDRHSPDNFPSRANSQVQHCTIHPSCNDVKFCQRFNPLFNAPLERKNSASNQQPRSDADYGGSFSQERNTAFHRSNSGRETPTPPVLTRSKSTKDELGHRSEMTIENWRDHPASRSVHEQTERAKHRVTFNLTENHEPEGQKLREKRREDSTHTKKVLSAAKHHPNHQQPPLRYNYEQPGFIEREKENISGVHGKAYTIYGVKEVKECGKGGSRRHQELVRAFSVRENCATYAKMPRAYSVNAQRSHVMPMECETCGKGGIGIVFLGVPGSDQGFCKVCKSSCGGPDWSPSADKPKKKKSIMEYCRKLLRISHKHR